METPVQAPPKKPNTVLIIVIVVAVVLLCCCVLFLVVPMLFGPLIGNIFSSINNSLLTPAP